jgi:hypothetical protein
MGFRALPQLLALVVAGRSDALEQRVIGNMSALFHSYASSQLTAALTVPSSAKLWQTSAACAWGAR